MSLNLLRPHYPFDPITTVAALARCLRVDVDVLVSVASKANGLYRVVKPVPPSTRQCFDALQPLKSIHEQIKHKIFFNVDFPSYLQGSIKKRSYYSNAELHIGQQILVTEDVKKFFPSVHASKVYDVWRKFFLFSPDVANLLTKLTTKDDALVQGAIPSSYLANLVLWEVEPFFHARFAAEGITYSRYVDDMIMSSKTHLTKRQQTRIVACVMGMVREVGLSIGREKHKVYSASKPMLATKVVVNKKPSLTVKKRSAVRAQVLQFELAVTRGDRSLEVFKLAEKASQAVGQLGRFHKTAEAKRLRERVQTARRILKQSGGPVFVTSPARIFSPSFAEDSAGPAR